MNPDHTLVTLQRLSLSWTQKAAIARLPIRMKTYTLKKKKTPVNLWMTNTEWQISQMFDSAVIAESLKNIQRIRRLSSDHLKRRIH